MVHVVATRVVLKSRSRGDHCDDWQLAARVGGWCEEWQLPAAKSMSSSSPQLHWQRVGATVALRAEHQHDALACNLVLVRIAFGQLAGAEIAAAQAICAAPFAPKPHHCAARAAAAAGQHLTAYDAAARAATLAPAGPLHRRAHRTAAALLPAAAAEWFMQQNVFAEAAELDVLLAIGRWRAAAQRLQRPLPRRAVRNSAGVVIDTSVTLCYSRIFCHL